MRGLWQRFEGVDSNAAATEELYGYWQAYGGLAAIIKSPAVWFSLIFTTVCYPAWHEGKWPDATLSALPSLLGFSLGAMGIILAFPSSPLFKLFSERGRTDSYYLDLASRFVHFIFVQVIALLFALVGKSYNIQAINFIGFFFLVYAISSAAFAALSLFGVAQVHNHPNTQKYLEKNKDD
ncbi:hypothetical protein [Methylobacterium bullatum]|uniref:hypothetical protein n=1 Tax=Methylobacterium bullatum TaxID=570505 RepID=UPI0030CA7D41